MNEGERTGTENRLSFSLTQLQAFSTLARTLSYVEAAPLLGYSEPALHYQLKRLEKALGCSLLVKSGRALQLTSEGARLLPQCISLLREAAALPFLTTSRRELDTLSIAGGRVTAAYTLPQTIADTRRKLPSLHIELRSQDRATVVQSVRNGDVDIGISHSLDQIVDSDEFLLTGWRDIAFSLLESSSLESSITRDSSEVNVYAVGQMNAPLSSLLSALSSAGITPSVLYAPSAEAVKSMCRAGLGLSFLRTDSTELEVRSGVLLPSPLLAEPIGSTVWAIQPKDRPISSAAKHFLKLTTVRSTGLTTGSRAKARD